MLHITDGPATCVADKPSYALHKLRVAALQLYDRMCAEATAGGRMFDLNNISANDMDKFEQLAIGLEEVWKAWDRTVPET